MITNEQNSIHLNIAALVAKAFFLDFHITLPVTLFLSLYPHICGQSLCVCVCVCVCVCMILSIWASLVSADQSGGPFSPFKVHKRYYSTSNLWSFSSQGRATGLLSEDGQSRWITTVRESDDEGEELICSPPPAALCPQINPWTSNRERRSPSWSDSLWSQPSPSRSADSSRQPPLHRQ